MIFSLPIARIELTTLSLRHHSQLLLLQHVFPWATETVLDKRQFQWQDQGGTGELAACLKWTGATTKPLI